MVEWKARQKRPTIDDRALDRAAKTYPGYTAYESAQRAAFVTGYLAGWRAAKREKRR